MTVTVNPGLIINSWTVHNILNQDNGKSSGAESFHEESHKKTDKEKYQGKSSKELLDTYLKDASFLMYYDGKHEAAKEAKRFLNEDGLKKELLGKISAEDIAKKEKELKAQAKAAPFKAKASYAMNVETHSSSSFSANLFASMLPGIAVIASSAKQESTAVLFAGAALTIGGLMAQFEIPGLVKGRNPEEKKTINDYYDVKHSLVALKQLKRAIRKENGKANLKKAREFLAEGFGNPGGMITVPTIVKQKTGGR